MIDLFIFILLGLCVLAGYYRGTIYAAINFGLTILSFFLALIMIPMIAGVIKNSESLYKSMLYYFEGYEYVSTTSVERVHDLAADLKEEELQYLIDNANMPIPMGDAVRKNIRHAAYARKGIVTIGDYFNQTIVDVVINILSLLALFVVIRVLLGWILKAVDFSVDGLPVMSQYDAVFACGIGFLHGVLILYIVFFLVPVALTVIPALEKYLNQSIFGGFFYRINPLLWLIPTT